MILQTERLIIREFTDEDIDLIYDINNDSACIRFNGWDSMSYERCQEEIRKWIEKYSFNPGTGAFCVENKTEKTKIGMAFIVGTDKVGEYEVGFRLRRIHWEKGYAKEITKGFIEYSKSNLKVSALIAEVYKSNIRSRKVFENLNFSRFQHPHGEDGLVYRYNIK